MGKIRPLWQNGPSNRGSVPTPQRPVTLPLAGAGSGLKVK